MPCLHDDGNDQAKDKKLIMQRVDIENQPKNEQKKNLKYMTEDVTYYTRGKTDLI